MAKTTVAGLVLPSNNAHLNGRSWILACRIYGSNADRSLPLFPLRLEIQSDSYSEVSPPRVNEFQPLPAGKMETKTCYLEPVH